MAQINYYFDTRKARKDGTYPLKLMVNHSDATTLVGTDLYFLPDQFKDGKVVNHPQKAFLNIFLREKLVKAQSHLLKLPSKQIKELNSKQLKDILEREDGQNEDEEQKSELSFFDYYESYISRIIGPKSKYMNEYTLKTVKKFVDKDLLFSDINAGWLKQFEFFMSKTMKVNSRGLHFRNIRAVINDAINSDLISQSLYPFKKFKIKKAATIKRSLTAEELVLLRDYPCEEYQERYRDLFMLMFYLRGINLIDLLNLKTINQGRIEYSRSRTKKIYSVEVLPEAQAIIEKYKGENYLLNVLDIYSNHEHFRHRMNDGLKSIGPMTRKGRGGKKIRHPLFPNITTYWTRHTWATIAASLDIPKETIAAGLGHNIGSPITAIYINFDMKKVDVANRQILEYVKSYSGEPYTPDRH